MQVNEEIIFVDEQLKYRIALKLIHGVGDVLAKNLVAYCGSPEAVFKEKKSRLEKIPEIGPVTAGAIINHNSFERAEQEILFIKKNNITPLFYLDKAYPTRLKNCADAPVMLYYKGSASLNAEKIISIIGTRNATDYGRNMCEKIIDGLAAHQVTIVSGLAYGIDITAHKSALKNNLPTIGVMAHGHDRLYPSAHKSASEKMIDKGGLLTEFISETNPDKENFPTRNRIVAGIADAILVIESGIKGGSLITTDIALSYNRDVFAVPGNAGEKFSAGCNNLIRTNKAALVETAEDIAYMMGWEQKDKINKEKIVQKKLFLDLKPEEKILVDLLQTSGKTDIDTICSNSKFSAGKASALLLQLEFSGIVKSLPGKLYELS